MPNETVVLSITGANVNNANIPLNIVTTPDSSAPGTYTGFASYSYIGSNHGNDDISATATILGSSSTGSSLNSGSSSVGFTVPDVVSSVTLHDDNHPRTYSFTVIAYFPDGTHTGGSNVCTIYGKKYWLGWTAIPLASYYKIWCTQAYSPSYDLNISVGQLTGTGSHNYGVNSWTTAPPSPGMYMDEGPASEGGWWSFKGDNSLPPSNTTASTCRQPSTTGSLVITGTGAIQPLGSLTSLTVTLKNITYANLFYIPVYEGKSGLLYLYNSKTNNSFIYPTYNSQTVSKTAAITSKAVQVTGDSTQGRMTIASDGTNYWLAYNGATPDKYVDTTTMTISAADIAWYDPTNGFDLYPISNGAGGVFNQFLVTWLVKPAIASVSPLTGITADGANHTFAVTLINPISPRQLGTKYSTGNHFSSTFGFTGAGYIGKQDVYDSNGWLTGWNVTAAIPTGSSNTSITMTANITGVITYLNASSGFTNESVTYLTGDIQKIDISGLGYTAPSVYSFTVSPDSSSYSSEVVTVTGIVFQQQNNPITMNFIGVNQTTSAQSTLGTGVQQSRVTGNSGWLTTFTAVISNALLGAGSTIGFVATDSTSGYSVKYLTSKSYTYKALIVLPIYTPTAYGNMLLTKGTNPTSLTYQSVTLVGITNSYGPKILYTFSYNSTTGLNVYINPLLTGGPLLPGFPGSIGRWLTVASNGIVTFPASAPPS